MSVDISNPGDAELHVPADGVGVAAGRGYLSPGGVGAAPDGQAGVRLQGPGGGHEGSAQGLHSHGSR